jgi:tetratricopeptide (TPR) repeat protein
MIADRFLLIPSLGWVIVLAMGIKWIFKLEMGPDFSFQSMRSTPKYTFLAILLVYSPVSFTRNLDWSDRIGLMEHDISYVDNSAQAHNLLAMQLMKRSFDDNDPARQAELRIRAVAQYRKAIMIYPTFFNATYDLARTYYLLKNEDSAIFFFKQTLAIDSTFSDASMTLGDALVAQNKLDEARPYYEKMVKRFPANPIGYDKLIYISSLQKDYYRALAVSRRAITAMPSNPEPYITMAKVYHNIKRDDSSAVLLEKAIAVDPGNQEAKKYLQILGK